MNSHLISRKTVHNFIMWKIHFKCKCSHYYLYFRYRSVSFCNKIVIGCFMVFNATFNNISVISLWSVLLVEETGVPREKHWPVTSHWQIWSHNVVSSTPRHEQQNSDISFNDVQLFVINQGTQKDILQSCKNLWSIICSNQLDRSGVYLTKYILIFTKILKDTKKLYISRTMINTEISSGHLDGFSTDINPTKLSLCQKCLTVCRFSRRLGGVMHTYHNSMKKMINLM